ncbi:MAG: hypothetical protein NVSMB42_22760 [Herpetosiphon sp.]
MRVVTFSCGGRLHSAANAEDDVVDVETKLDTLGALQTTSSGV